MQDVLKDIKGSATWLVVNPIVKGWSKDKKYYVETQGNDRLLLRLAEAKYLETKEKEYKTMVEVAKLGVNMSLPVDFGICGNGEFVYTLLTWIDGSPMDEVISAFSSQEQYSLGLKDGKVLKLLHSIPAPSEQEHWEPRMRKKIALHAERYKACGVKVENDDYALAYIESNLDLLSNRPQAFQHGDYHMGNLVLTPNRDLGVIDFNRWDYGDPWEEFYKMMLFSRELSIPFVQGQIHGYFDGDVPDLFHRLVALYMADVILFSVVWAIPFGSNEVDGMIKRAAMVMSDYNNFRTHLPCWLNTR